jgi:hypothetical protein
MADQVISMAPRVPVRDAATLAQYPARPRGAGRPRDPVHRTRRDRRGGGAASVLPMMPAMPVEVATETLALVGIELKMIAELHEVYGLRAPGSAIERTTAYVGS